MLSYNFGYYLVCYQNYIYIYIADYKITYFVATLSYDNYYVNLRNYSNSLLRGLL
jgi:hypothetical protein